MATEAFISSGELEFFRVEKGKGEVLKCDGQRTKIKADVAFIIPAGARHNVINTGGKHLKLYTALQPARSITTVLKAAAATKSDGERLIIQSTSTATPPNSVSAVAIYV